MLWQLTVMTFVMSLAKCRAQHKPSGTAAVYTEMHLEPLRPRDAASCAGTLKVESEAPTFTWIGNPLAYSKRSFMSEVF